MAMNPLDYQTITLELPNVTLSALPASSKASAIDDPVERQRLAVEQAWASVNAGSRLAYDDVVDPREPRNALLADLSLTDGREAPAPTPRSSEGHHALSLRAEPPSGEHASIERRLARRLSGRPPTGSRGMTP